MALAMARGWQSGLVVGGRMESDGKTVLSKERLHFGGELAEPTAKQVRQVMYQTRVSVGVGSGQEGQGERKEKASGHATSSLKLVTMRHRASSPNDFSSDLESIPKLKEHAEGVF
jgi:hypothetical protein